MRLAITGPAASIDVDRAGARIAREFERLTDVVEERLTDVVEVVTGGARGVDVLAGRMALVHFPSVLHRLILPAAPYDEAGVAKLIEVAEVTGRQVEIEFARPRVTRAAAYMERNDLVIARADALLALPRTGVETRRSGTWSTVRRARKNGLPVRVAPLDSDGAWTEHRGDLLLQ